MTACTEATAHRSTTQRVGRRTLASAPPLLLSDRSAAKLLGVSRVTVAELRRAKRLRAVKWLGGFRIPLEEVQRLAREGLTDRPTRLSRKRQVAAASPADAIRAIDVEAL